MKKILALLAAGFVLTGCSTTDTAVESSSEAAVSSVVEESISVTIQVSVDGEGVDDLTKTLEVEEGAILLDVMKEHYEIEETDTFINTINGYQQDDANGKYWLFDVNGEMGMKGANETELQEGDVIEWKLEKI